MNALIPNPRINRSRIICTDHDHRAVSLVAVMSPNPTVEKTVTVKYSASVRVRSSWLKFPVPNVDIRKYVDANRSRNSGTVCRQRLDRPDAGRIRADDPADLPHDHDDEHDRPTTTTRSHADNRQAPSTGAT